MREYIVLTHVLTEIGLFSAWTPANAPKIYSSLHCFAVLLMNSSSSSLSLPAFLVWGQSSTVIMADESDMRNELADLQTRADQIADEVQ